MTSRIARIEGLTSRIAVNRGIGADSTFVFVDCWKQTRFDARVATTLGRLNLTLSRTFFACRNTTLTTVTCFAVRTLTTVT